MTRCLVTDRRRTAGSAAPFAEARRQLLEHIRTAITSNVELIQVRERDLEAADLAALVADILALARGSASRIVVNDRLDVALACGADGVHLRGDSFPPRVARRITPAGFLIGRSVHAAGDVADAEGADYLIAGTVFSSVSKPGGRAIGLDGLQSIVRASRVPVLAIGGVTAGRMDDIAAVGAAGAAGIGLFLRFDRPEPIK